MVRTIPRVSAIVVVVLSFSIAGCAPVADPAASPSAEPSPSVSVTPSAQPEPDLTLPTCDSMFSAELVSALGTEGLVLQPDNRFGGPSTFDAVLSVVISLSESVTCTWVLPNSDTGFTTTVAIVSSTERSDLAAALSAPEFTASAALGGELYSYEYNGEGTYFTESHVIVGDVSVSTTYGSGVAEPLTLDAAGQVLP